MERGFGGGQPCGLAAASARGRRPLKAGGGPKNTTDSHPETLCTELVLASVCPTLPSLYFSLESEATHYSKAVPYLSCNDIRGGDYPHL
jgi:hypothetical protein